MTLAVETKALTKSFGATRALNGIDLKIRRGAVFGLLGPNGAGKTTTMRILTTVIKPDGGTAIVMGHDVAREPSKVRQRISLTGQYASVDDELSGLENLVLVGRLLGMPWRDAKERASELLGAFGLAEATKRQVRTYSGGMRRRIDIAASLVVAPDVLFLDEPTSGLDPRSRNQVWDIIRKIAARGTTVLLTTQYLEEADRLAERLAVIDHGRLIAEGTSGDLKASVGANALHVRLADPSQRITANGLVARVLRDVAEASRVIASLSTGGVKIREFSLSSPSLDDVFFALTGRPAEEKTKSGAEPDSMTKEVRQ
jgi:ABC-2 type transport system ATP-binding protein